MANQKNIYLQVLYKTIKAFLSFRQTYCALLWERVFIDHNGRVYACCYYRPGIIGNIYRHSLGDIWKKSLFLKLFRFMSLSNCLWCFEECRFRLIKEKAGSSRRLRNQEYPKAVWILYGEFCNQSCIMCRQHHRSETILDNEVLKRNIDWSRVEEVGIQGGEVLAIRGAEEFYVWLTR